MRAAPAGRLSIVAALVLVFLTAPAAQADVTSPDDLPDPTTDQLAHSVQVWEVGGVHDWSTEGAVTAVETEEEDAGETVITLATDILFTPDSWDLPDSAPERIEEVLADVPDGADLSVSGHTDSVAGAVDNQELSKSRAEAVADVISDVRADLSLEVQGFADSQPKARESGEEDQDARRENRRVELRYES